MATAVHPILPAVAPLEGRVPARWPGMATEVLDLLRDAVLVLAQDACSLGMNRAARELMREGDGLALANGSVVASTQGATAALRRAVERAAAGETINMLLPRPSRRPLTLLIEPLAGCKGDAPAAVVIATELGSAAPSSAELTTRFGFTPAECCVARRIAAGEEPGRIASEQGITTNTVRGHLKQIFVKTRTHRQAELVSRLLSGN